MESTDNIKMNYENCGRWWSDNDIELIKKDGHIYALDGWNGEKYLSCWECGGAYNMDAISESDISIKPIYRYDIENINLNVVDENSDEWEYACEIVDYQVDSSEISLSEKLNKCQKKCDEINSQSTQKSKENSISL